MSKRFLQTAKVSAGLILTFFIIVASIFLLPLHAEAAPDDASIMKKL